MKITYCDVCGKVSNEVIQVEVLDGEHPHNGSTVYKDIDICIPCLKSLDLKLNMEFSDILAGKCKRK